jgi:hypothetical protein
VPISIGRTLAEAEFDQPNPIGGSDSLARKSVEPGPRKIRISPK